MIDLTINPYYKELSDKAISECNCFLEWLQDVDRELWAQMIEDFTVHLQIEYPELFDYEPVSGQQDHEKIMVQDVNIDLLDITGLETNQARSLALLLAKWNGRGPVYAWHNGKRYLNKRIKTLQINHKLLIDLGINDILEHIPKYAIYRL